MNCTNCGAAMTIVAGRDYFRCDHCISFRFPPGAGEEGVHVVGGTCGLECPVCKSPLEDGRIEGESVCYCPKCRGFLASNPTFATIVRNRRAKRPSGDSTHSFCTTELKRKLDCPQCRKRMDTHPYYGGGRVVVDTCCACALIWLDAGELTIIEQHNPLPSVRNVPTESAPVTAKPAYDVGLVFSALLGWQLDSW